MYIIIFKYIELLDRYSGNLQRLCLIRYPSLFLKLWKNWSQGTALSICFWRLQSLAFLSAFSNVSQTFHLSNFNNISQKIFLRPLFNSYFCFNLITKFCFKDFIFFLQQFFKFSQNIYTSFSFFYIRKLYKFLDFKIILLPVGR